MVRNCAPENLEIPRCAIAHLRSDPSDHPGMTTAELAPSISQPLVYRLSARQRSGGSVNQTSLPFATLMSLGVLARKVLPSATSTM
jgi:hypothetical protein